MKEVEDDMQDQLLEQNHWRVIDQSASGLYFPARQSFAIDDSLCRTVGSGHSPAAARTWVHPNTVVLGIQDTRLPYLADGLKLLQEKGHQYVVRNSGGLSVVLDKGVLNISLIFAEGKRRISIDQAYEAMVTFTQQMLKGNSLDIEAREITTSYCPGRYDLSHEGKKFAGISQRRLRNGVAVQIYLCVSGSGSARAAMIRDFYEAAIRGQETKFHYPEIVPGSMASLEELTGQELKMGDLMLSFYHTLKSFGPLEPSRLSGEELDFFRENDERMIKRNEKVFKPLDLL